MRPFVRIRPSFLLALLVWASSIPLMAQKKELRLPPGMKKVASVEGITEYSLPNGLRVLLFPDPSKPTITVNITYKVGSRHENYGEKGMAHLLEHLVFKGTPRHPNIPQELTERGARPNGTTWFDRTNYFETFEATEDNLRWALDLESDRMVNSFIARKDLESEFSVVRNEYEMGENSPYTVLNKRMMATIFQWHNYGKSTIGEKSDIEGAPIERLQAFYKHYYQPDNAVLIIAGKIDEQRTLELVHEYFSPIPKPERQLIPTYTREPVQDGERRVVVRRVGNIQLFSVAFRTPANAHPDYVPLVVLADLLTDDPAGRLYKALVETKKAVSVFGSASGYAEDGVTSFTAEVALDQSLDEVKNILLAELEKLKTTPPTQDEVEQAKKRLLKNWELAFRQSDRIGISLSNYIGAGDWRLAFLYRDRLEKVTPNDVARVAAYYFKEANRTLGFFIPDKSPDRVEVPPPPNVEEMLKDYKGREAIAQGEDFDPSPENIERRTTRGRLPNGMKYALLPKKTRGESVNVAMTFYMGDLKSLNGKATIGSMAASMLNRGTKKRTLAELKAEQDRLKARITISGSASSTRLSIETDRAHLAEAIRLAGEMLRQPSFPVEEFEKLKKEYITRLESQKSDPLALGVNTFNRITRPAYPQGDPRRVMSIEEEIAEAQAVTLEQIRDFYQRFYGASYATCAIVGDFDLEEIERVLRETFGDWKSPASFTRIPQDYEPVPVKTETILTPDKPNAVYLAGLGFPMRNDDPDYPALVLGGQIIGGGFLNSRLATRIRQQDGLSYSVSASFSASPLDKSGNFLAFMIYNPTNLARLETAFREEIERVMRDGFTAEEVEAARSGWLKSRRVDRSSDNALAQLLNNYLLYDRNLNWDAEFERKVEKLTAEQVSQTVRKYLDYARLSIVKAGNFEKQADR
ncbi:MAG: insulinase family protein [Saprospiraceae bacterium]|nr:insulinase family protein [Saprospiraceae bacterium]MDW8483140.1 pitrilysin family protein [Saprospiraceae bacterium]